MSDFINLVKAPDVNETLMDAPLLGGDDRDRVENLGLEFNSLTQPSNYMTPLERLK